MELLQQTDIKAPVSAQKTPDNQVKSRDADGVESGGDNAFKDQLNEQIDQVKAQAENHNSENNQEDNLVTTESTQGEVEAAEATPDEHVSALENESTSANSLNVLNGQYGEITNPLIASLLPETGSTLPPSKVSSQGYSPAQAVVTAGQSTVDVEMAQKYINDRLNETSLTSANQKMPTVSSEVALSKTPDIPSNLTAILSEKANIQDARYTKVVSEMPTTDVITQTTRMQQVPLTTALSSSLISAQNISTGPVIESSNALNHVTPLNNSLTLSITSNIQNADWSQQMTQQVAYMVKGGFQQAEIKLNPANLGPMEIKLSMSDDNANINFVTQHVQVRDALDAALPRLKEMLEQQGLNLSDVNVSTQSEQQQANAESQQDDHADGSLASKSNQSDLDSQGEVLTTNMDVSSGVSIFA